MSRLCVNSQCVEQYKKLLLRIQTLCVAIDGSWQKRGHTSVNGLVTLRPTYVCGYWQSANLDVHPMSE